MVHLLFRLPGLFKLIILDTSNSSQSPWGRKCLRKTAGPPKILGLGIFLKPKSNVFV